MQKVSTVIIFIMPDKAKTAGDVEWTGQEQMPTTPYLPTVPGDLEKTVVEVPELELAASCTSPSLKTACLGNDVTPSDSEGECRRRREKCALFIGVELYQPFCHNAGSRAVPTYAWNEEIIADYVAKDVPFITQIIILNQMECLLFAGRRNKKDEGFSWPDAQRYVAKIAGAVIWVGRDVIIQAVPVTVAKAKVDIAKAWQFIRSQTLERIAKKS